MTFNTGIEAAALLPCPFCGNEPWSRNNSEEGPLIYCCSDDCMGPHTTAATMQDAIVQWNTRPSSSAPVEQREAVAGHDWEGSFTAEEFLERAKDHDKAAKNGLAAGPNVSYVRTFQACSVALRYAADHMFALPGSSRDEVRCLFCRKTIGDDDEAITDDNGEIACKTCGEAEFKTQAEEAHEAALKSGGAK